MATNISSYIGENWPSVKSEYVEAYNFEVFDLLRAHSTFSQLRPWAIAVTLLYILLVFGGQAFMRNRAPFQLKGPLTLWNILLALFSIATFVRCWPEFWFTINRPQGIFRSICSHDVHSYATAFWALLFTISKLVEFGDTAFIILRKQKLIFLHWYHHTVTFFVGFLLWEAYDPATKIVIIVNSFIHSWMYSYYALKALKFRIPEQVAKFITVMQISQMILVFGVNVYSLYIIEWGIPCERRRTSVYSSFAAAGIFFILFSNFFSKRYRASQKAKLN